MKSSESYDQEISDHPEQALQQSKVFDFIAAGIGCNCMILLSESGVLAPLVANGFITQKEIENCPAPLAIQSALKTLEKCKVIKSEDQVFAITEFGIMLAKYSGLITMLFEGYGNLMSHQNEIAKKKPLHPEKWIRGEAVSRAAVQLAAQTFDPIILEEFAKLEFSGTICDLGCGYGRMLSQVCKISGNPGLGFDSELEVVKRAKELFEGTDIAIELGNITQLEGVWEDVVVLMQCHVFHDFTPNDKCIKIMDSYLANFPHLRYFFYLDTVSPSKNRKDILPGFDYVHGLLNIETRTYEETIHLFECSQYTVIKEVPIEGLPNTFLWLLSPKKNEEINMTLNSETTILNRSHFKRNASFESAVHLLKEEIRKKGDMPHVSIEQQMAIVDELCEFPFGRYILERKGANGFWTDYLISYRKEHSKKPVNATEDFILNRSLIVLAHRERFSTFQKLIQDQLKTGTVLASIPCGLMKDLTTLDFSKVANVKLVGVDLDSESIELAQKLAQEHGQMNTEFFQKDAWQLSFQNEFDVITSSGLNVYEADPEKVLELYRLFFKALKPGGSLVISSLTYPPTENHNTDWALNRIPKEDVLMEQILYKDILNLHWRNFRSSCELDKEFKEVGFSEVSIHFDSNRVFPTILARKPG